MKLGEGYESGRGNSPAESIFNRVLPNALTAKSDELFALARKNSPLDPFIRLACCAIEMISTHMSHHDFDRFGILTWPSPRQADVMIVAGTVVKKMADPIKLLYEQMPDPKWVVAMGSCATNGGPYYRSYSVVMGVDHLIPVDVYVPGLPSTSRGAHARDDAASGEESRRTRSGVARRPRRELTIPEAPPALDAAGDALARLVQEIFSPELDAEVGVAVDEVTLTVGPESVVPVCSVCKSDQRLDFDYLRCLSVVDYVEASGELEVNYHLYSYSLRHKMVVKTRVPEEMPVVPTVASVWTGAGWYEREGHDLFGVRFEGHPNLVPLLLYEGFEGFPGRKSFPFHEYDEW